MKRRITVTVCAMFRLKESIHVNAPIERCFLISTSIALVQQTIGLKPVAGKTSGNIVDGDRLTWRGWKFGIPARHETLITGYTRPTFFQDTQASGYFKHFQHDHFFHFMEGHTILQDVLRFTLPFGFAGHLVAKHIVQPHISSLLLRRFNLIKRVAEGDDWQRFIDNAKDREIADAPTEEHSILMP